MNDFHLLPSGTVIIQKRNNVIGVGEIRAALRNVNEDKFDNGFFNLLCRNVAYLQDILLLEEPPHDFDVAEAENLIDVNGEQFEERHLESFV